MSVYDLIMSWGKTAFNRMDWSRLGQRLITDEKVIADILSQGYEAMVDNE